MISRFIICDVPCQNQAFVAEMSCSVMMFLEKNVTLAFIFNYQCVYALPIQSYACFLEQAVVITLYKITEPRKRKLKVEILHDLKEF